jgi:hypothetical protein
MPFGIAGPHSSTVRLFGPGLQVLNEHHHLRAIPHNLDQLLAIKAVATNFDDGPGRNGARDVTAAFLKGKCWRFKATAGNLTPVPRSSEEVHTAAALQ